MNTVLAIQLCDYYKNGHPRMYDESITKLVSYYAIRGSRMPDDKNYVVNFGLQAFVKEYLIEYWKKNFFDLPWEEIYKTLKEFYDETFVKNDDFLSKLHDLWKLGYLPLRVYEVPEGGICELKTPIFMMETTDPRFPWIGEFTESLVSSFIWKMNLDATVGHWYRLIVDKYYNLTVEDSIPHHNAISDFGFRGANTPEAGIRTSAAWLCSFKATATCGAIPYIKEYYGGEIKNRGIGGGLPSTEHSVMCSSAAIDGDEITLMKRLLTKVYPHDSFTMVSDSYDYWNVVKNLIPSIKDMIMNHNKLDGTPCKMSVRGDSGDPVRIVAGMVDITHRFDIKNHIQFDFDEEGYATLSYEAEELLNGYGDSNFIENYLYINYKGKKYYFFSPESDEEMWTIIGEDECVNKKFTEEDRKGTIEYLWETFGGSTNSKGYYVLDPHIGLIYGDSITPNRAEYIYKILELKGFAANNVALGAGSFSFHCLEDSDGNLRPFTRDSYNAAIKATYGETSDGRSLMIFKDPKTDNAKFKKSLRGCCHVVEGVPKNYYSLYGDGFTLDEFRNLKTSAYELIFENGMIKKEWSIDEIRQRLYNNKF